MSQFLEYLLACRRLLVVGLHALLFALAYVVAFLIRFEFFIPANYWDVLLLTLPFVVLFRLVVFFWFQLHEGLWRYVSIRDMVAIVKSVTIGTLALTASVLVFFRHNFPRSVLLLDWLLCTALVAGIRLGVRVFRESSRRFRQPIGKPTLIVGAGDAGEMLFREIERNSALEYEVVGFIDDEAEKQGLRIHGAEVVGTIDQLSELCHSRQVREVLIAIPSANGEQMRRIIRSCRAAKVNFKTLPGVGELMGNGEAVSKIRRVQIADLLRRKPVQIDRAEVEAFVRHKRILVTGAGGSIGSELSRQLASFEPDTLVLLDRAENNLFFVEMELRDRHPNLALFPVVCDVSDEQRIGATLREHKPQIVFHAAAHKHVPLMERNKIEAVKNNVLGTMTLANAAWRAGVEEFVMISTDKAVRPSSVMGATKRLAEMYVQALDARIETRFMTVRFGNVLGSEGSVLQIFQRQIEAGGPVTVTHPDMMRYFMTIPEACQLVLQAVTHGEGGEIFLLDMGEPIRIVDLAKDLITLMGLEPEKDIEIKFTGVRPGEKIFEQLLNPETKILPTVHEKIMVVETTPVGFEDVETSVSEVVAQAKAGNEEALMAALKLLVPGYQTGTGSSQIQPEKHYRILLATANASTRSTLKRILESDYQVHEAENRRQALEKVKEHEPHLIILGLNLPPVGIRRLCNKIKLQNSYPPPHIILLTESAGAANLGQARTMGADDLLPNPISVDVLEKRVSALLVENPVLEEYSHFS